MKDSCTSNQSCSPASQSGGQCSSQSCCDADQDMFDKLMKLTECAKKDLMKQKIMAKLDAKMGDKMDEVATLMTDILLEKWNIMQSACSKKEEAKKKLEDLMKN